MKLRNFILQLIGIVILTVFLISDFFFHYSKTITTIVILIGLAFIIIGNIIYRITKKNGQ